MTYATSTIHKEDVKQCRWAAICFLLNTLLRECGAYFAQSERNGNALDATSYKMALDQGGREATRSRWTGGIKLALSAVR